MNIATMVSKSARAYSDRIAVRSGVTSLTYAELNDTAGRFASALYREGLRSGDRVAIYSRNVPEYVVALIGTFKAGMVAVPVNVRLHARELLFIAQNADIALLVYGSEQAEAVEAVRNELPTELLVSVGNTGGIAFDSMLGGKSSEDTEVGSDQLAWLFYTSGTTGRPKGAMLSHRNLERMTVGCLGDVCAFQPDDVVLHIAPFSHGSGLYLLPSLARGAENLILDNPHLDADEVLSIVERERVTVIPSMAPTVIVKLLSGSEERDTGSLRDIVYGGAPIHLEHLRAAVARFGQVFVQIYGQGESR